MIVGDHSRQLRESLSLGYWTGNFSPPDGPFDRVWEWLVSREDAKNAKKKKRERRQDADRASAHDASFYLPLNLSRRLATKVYRPRKKSTGYPGRNRKWDWALHSFVPSRLRASREVKAEQKWAALPAFGSRVEGEPDREQVPNRDEKIELPMDGKGQLTGGLAATETTSSIGLPSRSIATFSWSPIIASPTNRRRLAMS